jgi:hypothetical protein
MRARGIHGKLVCEVMSRWAISAAMAFLDGGFGAMMVVVVGVGVEGGEIEVVLGLLLVLEL